MTESANQQPTFEELQLKAQSCLEQGDMPGALSTVEQIVEAIGTEKPMDRAKVLSNQGYLQAALEHFTEALASFNEASTLFKAENSPVNMAIQIGNMGSVYRDQGDHSKALNFYNQALEILKQQDYKPGIADQHSNIGYACSQNRDISTAVQHFTKALDIYILLGNEHKAEQCRQNIATLNSER